MQLVPSLDNVLHKCGLPRASLTVFTPVSLKSLFFKMLFFDVNWFFKSPY